jgi:uncharacterized protein YbjT (DUF2867 family)
MVLVIGATGPVGLGGEICRQLRAEGQAVRALVRKTAAPERLAALAQLGVDLVEGDLKDRATLDAACQGVETVISTATTTLSRQPGDTIESVDLAGQLQLVDAAAKAAVRHMLYVSISGTIQGDFPLCNAKRTVERRLTQSGMSYTILRPTSYMEVWLSPIVGFDYARAQATIYGEGRNPISWIARDDVARFAVRCLDHPAAQNATFELGQPFEIQHVATEALQAQQAAATDSLQRSFAGLMQRYAAGDAIELQVTLQGFPLRLTSVYDYARRVLGR